MSSRFNPFRPGSLVTPGMFCGRREELEDMQRCLRQTKFGNPQHIAVIGERGIGKSSLLLFFQSFAEARLPSAQEAGLNFLFLSIELSSQHSFIDIVRLLAADLKRVLREKEALLTKIAEAWEFLSKWEILGVRFHREKDSFDPISELNEFTSRIVEIVEKSGDDLDGVVILIDEADKPGEDGRLGELLKLFTERLAKRQCDRVLIGLAGLPDLMVKLASSHESSPRILEAMDLQPLEIEESKDVIRRGLEEANIKNDFSTTISSKALDLLAELSEGYPHFIQQFGFSAFEADEDYVIDEADVNEGAFRQNGALDQLGLKFFSKQYRDQIRTDNYRVMLDMMAEHGDAWLTRKEIIDACGIPDHAVDNGLRALKEKGIIAARGTDGKGPYRIPTKSFAAWIKAQKRGAEIEELADEPRSGPSISTFD